MPRYAITRRTEEDVAIYTLTDERAQMKAEIVPALGNTCIRFQQTFQGQTIDLLEPVPNLQAVQERPSGYGNPILFPFPNRVREGTYQFEGQRYEFREKNAQGHAIHGLVYTRPWQVEKAEASDAGARLTSRFPLRDYPELEEEYPFPFDLHVTYTLAEGKLLFDVDVENVGSGNMPMGFGIHPYFSTPLFPDTPARACFVQIPANRYWELDDCLPTGRQFEVSGRYDLRRGQPFEGMQFDDVFTDLTEKPSRCIIEDRPHRVRLVIESDASFREIVVYTPPGRNAIAIEPYTCVTDAINLQARGIDAGLIILPPGERFHAQIQWYTEHF